jgi:hypothetical protein
MKYLWAIGLLLAIATPRTVCAAPADAAAKPPSADRAATTETVPVVPIEDLHAFALANKNEYVLGEPVFFYLILANWSEKNTFEVQGYLHPANDLEIKATRLGEMPKRFTGGAIKDVLFPGLTLTLQPRELSPLRWPLVYHPDNPSGFFFDQPGFYTISCQARLNINRTPRVLTLPEFQCQVREPSAEQKAIVDRILRPDCAVGLQRSQVDVESAKIWQDVATRFPNSLWAPYARVLLARRPLEAGKSDYSVLLEQYEAILRNYPDFPLLDELCYLCAGCEDRLGRPLETLRWLYRIQREFPISPYLQPGNRLFRKYLYQTGWEDRYAPWYLRE